MHRLRGDYFIPPLLYEPPTSFLNTVNPEPEDQPILHLSGITSHKAGLTVKKEPFRKYTMVILWIFGMTHGLHQIHPSYPLFAPPSLIVKVHYMLQISLPTNTRTFPTYLLISRLISLIKFAAFTYPNFLSPMINCPGPLPTIASLPLNPPTLPYYNRTQTPLSHGSGSCIFLQKLRISYGYVVMKVYPQKLICISLALP